MTERELQRLGAIADELDALESRSEQLYAQRRALWRKGLEAGLSKVKLAELSRVRPVTVGQLLRRAGES